MVYMVLAGTVSHLTGRICPSFLAAHTMQGYSGCTRQIEQLSNLQKKGGITVAVIAMVAPSTDK